MSKLSSCRILLNRVVDIAAAISLYKTCPVKEKKLGVICFEAKDRYGWSKSKYIQRWIGDEDIENIKTALSGEVHVLRNENDLLEFMKESDICICLSREAFVFKPMSNWTIGVSGTRDYLNRYLDVIPQYGGRIKVLQNGPAWISECGGYRDEKNLFNEHSNEFWAINPLNDQLDQCRKIGRKSLRENLKFPTNKKVAIVSYRKADSWHTIYETDQEFFQASVNTINKLKDKGYFVVCRSRRGIDDIHNRRRNSAEITKYDQIVQSVDLNLEGWGGYPNLLYAACYAADVLAMVDTSGICQREAAITSLPIYMPYRSTAFFEKQFNNWEPGMADLIRRGLISNELSDLSREGSRESFSEYNKKWNFGGIKDLWEKVGEWVEG